MRNVFIFVLLASTTGCVATLADVASLTVNAIKLTQDYILNSKDEPKALSLTPTIKEGVPGAKLKFKLLQDVRPVKPRQCMIRMMNGDCFD